MSTSAPEALIAAALAAQQRAYAKYSRFPVGAALATSNGSIVVGCNVENRSFGLTNCAERTALFTAVTQGEQQFTALALASPGGVIPCGACLQVLSEFCEDLTIWLIDSSQQALPRRTSLRELLPQRFEWNASGVARNEE